LRRQMGSNRATVGCDEYCTGAVAKGTHEKTPALRMNQWEAVVAVVLTVETTGALLLADDGVVLGASLLDAWVRWAAPFLVVKR
jgi:hypothetical protein